MYLTHVVQVTERLCNCCFITSAVPSRCGFDSGHSKGPKPDGSRCCGWGQRFLTMNENYGKNASKNSAYTRCFGRLAPKNKTSVQNFTKQTFVLKQSGVLCAWLLGAAPPPKILKSVSLKKEHFWKLLRCVVCLVDENKNELKCFWINFTK